MALAAQRAAMTGTEANGQIDCRFLPFDLPVPLDRIRMSEVRRETDHRGSLARGLDGSDDGVHVCGRQAAEEPVVMLDAFPAQAGGITNPLLERRPARHQLVEVIFRENADSGR